MMSLVRPTQGARLRSRDVLALAHALLHADAPMLAVCECASHRLLFGAERISHSFLGCSTESCSTRCGCCSAGRLPHWCGHVCSACTAPHCASDIARYWCAGQALAGGHEQATTTYLTNGATTTVTTAAVNLDSHYQRTSKQQRSGENHDDGKAAAAAGAGAAAKADQTGAEAATVAGKAKRTATQRLQQLKNKGGKKKGLQPVRLGKGSKGSKHGKKGGSKRRR